MKKTKALSIKDKIVVKAGYKFKDGDMEGVEAIESKQDPNCKIFFNDAGQIKDGFYNFGTLTNSSKDSKFDDISPGSLKNAIRALRIEKLKDILEWELTLLPFKIDDCRGMNEDKIRLNMFWSKQFEKD